MKKLKKRTNGRVDITHYPGKTLTTAPKMFQGVVTGISDLGWAPIGVAVIMMIEFKLHFQLSAGISK